MKKWDRKEKLRSLEDDPFNLDRFVERLLKWIEKLEARI